MEFCRPREGSSGAECILCRGAGRRGAEGHRPGAGPVGISKLARAPGRKRWAELLRGLL